MKTYRNGPIQNDKRSCTDIFCLIMFILLNLAMLAIAIYSWIIGDFAKLTTPYDSDAKSCGVDLKQYPMIYFASPHVDSLWKTVCVKKCPSQNDTTLSCSPNSVVTKCQGSNIEIYQTQQIRGTLCMPTSKMIREQISEGLGIQQIDAKVTNLKHSIGIILISIAFVFCLSILFMLIIRITSGFFVYVMIAITFAALLAFGVYMLIPHQQQTLFLHQTRTVSIIIGIISIFLAVAILIFFICFRRRVLLAISITKVAAQFVNSNLLMVLLPVLLFAIMIIFLAIWIFEALGYYSLGVPVHMEKQLPFQHFETTPVIRILGGIHFFYLLWVLFFLVQSGDFLISGAACSWYFRRDEPYVESNSRYLNFHIGSVCMGSFFLALFGFSKFLYELLAPEEQKDGCQLFYKKCCDCCCYFCVNYIFQCFNSGAYTLVHLSGDGYCPSAWEALALRIKQPVSTGVVIFMQTVFSVLVRVSIVAITCFLCHALMRNVEPWKSEISDSTMPLIIIGIISFTIASFFVSIYSEAMSSIYVSYLADSEAGGSVSDDKAPEDLKIFLESAKEQNHFQ